MSVSSGKGSVTELPSQAAATDIAPAPAASPPAAAAPEASRSLSQWQLIRRRFARHRIAMISLWVLAIFYVVAVVPEIVAPYTPSWRNLDYAYAPPQTPRFSFEHGLHVQQIVPYTDPLTYRRTYTTGEEAIPLGFFVRGEPYRLFGLITWDRHLLGVRGGPTGTGDGASTFYLLGGDQFGRDLFSRIIYGARISLSIGLVGIVVTFILGCVIGGISGYVGGRADNMIQRLMEIIQSFPHLPLWLALAAILPSDWSPLATYFGITVVLAILSWTGLGRVVRGKLLSLREEDYAVAARLLGAGHSRIIFRHLLPGFTSHIIVSLTLAVPGMILGETALSFLGLGLQPPVVSWGVMLQDCMNMQAVANYLWLLMPAVFIVLTVLSFNFLGDGLRDAADPYST